MLLFLISSQDSSIYMHHPTDKIEHTLAFIRRRVLAGMRNSSMGLPWGIDQTTHLTLSGHSTKMWRLTPRMHTSATFEFTSIMLSKCSGSNVFL